MRYGIIGAGGVGGYFGGILARAGHTVHVIARGDSLAAIRRQHGLAIHTPTDQFIAPVDASDDPKTLDDTDLILVAVKGYSLPEIAPALRAQAARGATIVPLLNGVDIVDRLSAEGVARNAILPGAAYISAARTAPGVITRFSGPAPRIVVANGPHAEQLVADVKNTGVGGAVITDDITVELWRKFFFIAPMAAACGLARRAVGGVREAPLGRALIERATREVVALADALGIPTRPDEVDRVMKQIDALAPTVKPSFLFDLEHGGPTELDLLSGTVSRLARTEPARAKGVDTPVHDTATAALSPLLHPGAPPQG
jgi:2-dehydropantoate 2-reductase